MLKRINTVIISPYRGVVSKQFPAVYTPTRSHVVSVAGKTRLSRREEDDTRQTRKETIPYRTCSTRTLTLSFPSFFSPDLFSAIAIMAHRDTRSVPRRWQIRKERPFKLECDPWDGPPSTVINMQNKGLRSILAWKRGELACIR